MLQTDNLSALAAEIKKLVDNDRGSQLKRDMQVGLDYYNGRHDIEDYRLFYFNNEGNLVEEKNRSNVRIAHQYFTELVDQKVQYLLSNPVEVRTEQEGLQEYLDEYLNEDFRLVLQELVEGASQKSQEYVFWQTDKANRLRFKTADALKIIPIYDAFYNIDQVIYYYDDEITQDGKRKTITKIQLWTKDEVFYFAHIDGQALKLDDSEALNPRPHIMAKKEGNALGKGYGRVPFICLKNNRQGTNDLQPIKALIDDYDMMACALSNNLADFDHPIYAVRGFSGDDLNGLVTNLKTKKTVGVGEKGGIDVVTTQIPVDARKAKLEIDKEAIYKFGMGFDSSQTGDGNVTNVVIKSRYSLLDLKCNKIEARLRVVIKEMLELIVDNINQMHSKSYDPSELTITITRDVMANEVDNANMAKTEAETKQIMIANIMTAAPRLDDNTTLELLAGVLEVDVESIKKALEEQDYQDDFNQMTEAVDDQAEQVPAGNREPADQS